MTVLAIVGHSLLEGFFMLWGTLWALILGFTLSGAVQAFISKREMQKAMGDHRPRTIVRSGLWGIASSSCSYAATALAKSLFQRGADFVTAIVFMIASTNLVVELGIVLWLLVGWQFALAEFAGGVIMIILFAVVAPRIFPADELAAARERLKARTAASGLHGQTVEEATPVLPLSRRLRSRAGWADAAGYAISDLSMLRRELLIGYLVAGVLAVAVPSSVYRVLFFSGHGLWTDLVDAIIGPFIAFLSFVCSIGNIPLAAALFGGGLSFGGTIAFVFADLITLPLVLIYSKFYGWRLTLRLVFSLWMVMSASGLAVDFLFHLVRIPIPAVPAQIVPIRFEWNYTTFLNIVFIVIGAVLLWVYRSGKRRGSTDRYAKDPVCGMQVERASAPAAHMHQGVQYHFCSDRCHDRFVADPSRYIGEAVGESER